MLVPTAKSDFTSTCYSSNKVKDRIPTEQLEKLKHRILITREVVVSISDDAVEHSSKPTKDFNPELHLDFKPPKYIITMEGLGFRRGTGFSTVAASGPFSLFSALGLAAVRKELRGQRMPDCVREIAGIGKQTYGIAPRYAPFSYDFWTHPRTLYFLSNIAKVSLVPVEISQLNQLSGAYKTIKSIPWHRHPSQFVCVLMLSNMDGIPGGHTCFRGPSGKIQKLANFPMGSAYLLQGCYVDHLVEPFESERFRVTVVTSLRPKDCKPSANIPVSDLERLYKELVQDCRRKVRFQLTKTLVVTLSSERIRQAKEAGDLVVNLLENTLAHVAMVDAKPTDLILKMLQCSKTLHRQLASSYSYQDVHPLVVQMLELSQNLGSHWLSGVDQAHIGPLLAETSLVSSWV